MDQEMCRLCLSKHNLKPLFMNLTEWSQYSQDIMQTTGLKIEPYDGLPQSICKDCKYGITFALNLRNRSRETELELLKQGYIRSNESEKNLNRGATPGSQLPTAAGLPESRSHYPPSTLEPWERSQRPSNNENIIKTESSNDNDNDCSNNDGFREIKIEIECDRLSENGGDAKWPPLEEIKKMSRKAKREIFLGLVDEDFDPKGPIRCKVCKTIVNGWRCFTNHVQKHLGFKYVCEYCGKSFISTTQLKRHCMSYHGMKRELQCKHCSYLALDNVQLKPRRYHTHIKRSCSSWRHCRQLHERRLHTGERPYICDHCSSSYHSRPCLIQHLESHRTDATVQCEQCPRVFKSHRQLSRHRYAAHAQRARCRLCSQHYSLKYLRTHMAKCTGDSSGPGNDVTDEVTV